MVLLLGGIDVLDMAGNVNLLALNGVESVCGNGKACVGVVEF